MKRKKSLAVRDKEEKLSSQGQRRKAQKSVTREKNSTINDKEEKHSSQGQRRKAQQSGKGVKSLPLSGKEEKAQKSVTIREKTLNVKITRF